MNEHGGREASPPLSPLSIRAETVDRFSCRNKHTHIQSIHTCTRALVHRTYCEVTMELHPASSFLHLPLDSFRSFFLICFLSSHLLHHHPWCLRTPQCKQWSRIKQKKLNPLIAGCHWFLCTVSLLESACTSTQGHLASDPTRTGCKVGKFKQYTTFFVCLNHHARNTSRLLSVFMCQRLRDIY